MGFTKGDMLIGGEWVHGRAGPIRSHNAQSGEPIDPEFGAGDQSDVERACELAEAAFDDYRSRPLKERAKFLETIAEEIEALGDTLIERVMVESGLPRMRLEGERARTAGQLRLFAEVVRNRSFLGLRHDPALPERQPAPRPDLRLCQIPVGPVAVFGASNFPLAFSVAGGDTASALAAGCPVIVKAHSAHLGTSVLVAEAINSARKKCEMPVGTFSLLIGRGSAVGSALVSDPRVKAVGFTGSRSGGVALMNLAARRHEPIPVFAEMSSINPVLLFPHALDTDAEGIAANFIASLTLGAGQFCTNPGLVVAIEGPALDRFVSAAISALEDVIPAPMLTPSIHASYADNIGKMRDRALVVASSVAPEGKFCAQAMLFSVGASAFLSDPELQTEMFGPAALIVRCADANEMRQILEYVEGQLTIALHITEKDQDSAASLLPLLERKAGRLLVNGFGTGVEVAHAMVHGGPWPATSDSRTTSVGSLAIMRFMRPVCYQNFPEALLPEACIDDASR